MHAHTMMAVLDMAYCIWPKTWYFHSYH